MSKSFLPGIILAGILLLFVCLILVVAKLSNPTISKEQASTNPQLQLPTASPAGLATATQATESAQQAVPSPAIEIAASQSALATASARQVQFTLSTGQSFTMELYTDLAPKTVADFIQKVQSGFYNGLLIFRADKAADGTTALIQTGDPTNTGSGGGKMQAEYNQKPFIAGSVGIARAQNRDVNSDSQFFVTTEPVPGYTDNYTNFGQILTGLNVIKTIKPGQPIQTAKMLN